MSHCTRSSEATRWHLSVEHLEERTLLSGNVSVIRNLVGDLVVRGDNGANEIGIDQAGLSGDVVRITALNGTRVNGGTGSVEVANATRDIRVELRGGNDTVHLVDVHAPRNLVVHGGAGKDVANMDGTTAGRRVQVTAVERRREGTAATNALLAGLYESQPQAIAALSRQAATQDVMKTKLDQAIKLLTTPRKSEDEYLKAIDQGMEVLYLSNLVVLPTAGSQDTTIIFDDWHRVMVPALEQALTRHIDGVNARNNTVQGLGTPGSKEAAIEARNFIEITNEAMQVIGQQTQACNPDNPGTAQQPTQGCEQLVKGDEGGNVVDTVLGGIFAREVRGPNPFILGSSSSTPNEQVILTGPLANGQCAAIVKEIQGIKAVVSARQVPIWTQPWFSRSTIAGVRTVWTWEFVPAEAIKTISVCNDQGQLRTQASTQIVIERQLLHFWRFFRKDVTPVA